MDASIRNGGGRNGGFTKLYLVRHGETEWSLSGKHTGRTDVPLTKHGESQATLLSTYLPTIGFSWVASSPLARARETCKLAGFGSPHLLDDLMEWDYGDYEGLTTSQISGIHPGWFLWRDGVTGGEGISEISQRADRVLSLASEHPGDVILFSHGHFLRVLAARWLGLPASEGRLFALQPASVSALVFENDYPAIFSWDLQLDVISSAMQGYRMRQPESG
ncbi:MAG: histidine phosphatase family protein [Actinobacteria bacterium]|nr:histidine phosphatase family protein [Actinomycetota bacterium]MCL5447054.1 histidine phosphatase family protein [Actinomycetota bacterium]